MDMIDGNKVINEAFKAGCEEGRLAWPRPIPVSERLPEECVTVLAYDGNWWDAERRNGEWEEPGSVGLQTVSVTHWLPMPSPPE